MSFSPSQASRAINKVGEEFEKSNGIDAEWESFKTDNGVGQVPPEEQAAARDTQVADLEQTIMKREVEPIDQKSQKILADMGFIGQLKTEVLGGTPEEEAALGAKKKASKASAMAEISPEGEAIREKVQTAITEKGEFQAMLDTLPDILKTANTIEVKRSTIAKAQQAFVGATADNIQGIGNSAIDVSNAVDSFLKERGFTKTDIVSDQARLDFADRYLAEPQSTGEGVARKVLQYVIPYTGAAGALSKGSAAARSAKALLLGAGIDFIAIDPEEKRLSDLVQSSPMLANPIAAALASDPNDSKLQSRIKNSMEGLMVSGAVETGMSLGKALYSTVSGAKNARYITKGLEAEVIDKSARADEALKTIQAPVYESKSVVEVSGGKVTVDVNQLDQIDDPQKFVRKLLKDNPELKEKAMRGVQSVEQTAEAGAALAKDPAFIERVFRSQPGTAWNAEELHGVNELLLGAYQDLKKQHGLVRAGKGNAGQYADALEKMNALTLSLKGGASESARGTNHLRNLVRTNDEQLKAKMFGEISEMYGEHDVKTIARKLDEVFDVPASQLMEVGERLARKSMFKNVADSAHEVYINSLLSSVKTGVANVTAGIIRAPMEMAERSLAATFMLGSEAKNKITFKEVGLQAQEFASESWNQLAGGFSGIVDSLYLAGDAVRRGEGFEALRAADKVSREDLNYSTFLETRNLKPAISSEAYGYSGAGKDLIDTLGAIIRTPSNIMIKGDQAVGTIHYRMEVKTLAAREAAKRGLVGDDAARLIKNLSDDPLDELSPSIKNAAQEIRGQAIEKAETNKFTKELTGAAADLNSAIKKIPGGRFLIPFSKVELNILQQFAERTPGAVFLNSYKEAIASGGAQAAQARAKMAFGTAFMSLGGFMASQGLITGNGPRNRDTRQLLENSSMFQTNSIRMGDQYLKHDRIFEPYSSALTLAADLSELVTYAADTSFETDAEELFMVGGAMVAESLTPEFLSSSTADLMDALQSPDKKRLSRVVGNITTGLVPFSGALRDIRKTGIPGIVEGDTARRMTDEGFKKNFDFMQTQINRLKDLIPGLSATLPPRKNMWGEVIHYPPGLGPDIASPIASMEIKDDVVTRELTRLGVSGPVLKPKMRPGEEYLQITMPDKFIQVGQDNQTFSMEMLPKEYDRYVELSAGIGLRGVKLTLKDQLEKIISGGYRELGSQRENSNAQALLIHKYIEKYRSNAKKQLQVEDRDILDRARDLEMEARRNFLRLPAADSSVVGLE